MPISWRHRNEGCGVWSHVGALVWYALAFRDMPRRIVLSRRLSAVSSLPTHFKLVLRNLGATGHLSITMEDYEHCGQLRMIADAETCVNSVVMLHVNFCSRSSILTERVTHGSRFPNVRTKASSSRWSSLRRTSGTNPASGNPPKRYILISGDVRCAIHHQDPIVLLGSGLGLSAEMNQRMHWIRDHFVMRHRCPLASLTNIRSHLLIVL